MFVSKLLHTHIGNCHSIPLLYKIVAQELGAPVYLALAPNHTYIKLFTEKDGWYNTELTSAEFPLDAWIMASGYVHLNAIQNSIYMDTIGDKNAVAMCLIDLAQGYQRKVGFGDGSFLLQCCETTLQYFPNYINALLLQLEVRKILLTTRLKESGQNSSIEAFIAKDASAKAQYEQIKNDIRTIYQLGYRKMPDEMYMEWLATLKEQKEKYSNKNIANFNNR